MLSRAQEARIRDVLGTRSAGAIQMFCLEHLAADLAAFVRKLRQYGGCQTQYGGVCDADAHETARLLIWGPPARSVAQDLTS
jgi:hypothetical protein